MNPARAMKPRGKFLKTFSLIALPNYHEDAALCYPMQQPDTVH